MAKKNNNDFNLQLEINKALKECLRSATPNVCALAETEEGYMQVETDLITMCLTKAITPKQAIALLESELSNNE